jgi:hypothetical protein
LGFGAARLQRFQVFDEVLLRLLTEIEIEHLTVVFDDGAQGGEPTVVVEAALLPREQTRQRRRTVPPIRRAIGRSSKRRSMPFPKRIAWCSCCATSMA